MIQPEYDKFNELDQQIDYFRLNFFFILNLKNIIFGQF